MKRDEAYLRHMLEAISDIDRFIEGVTEEEFYKDKEKQYAVVRALEIIGEATTGLSKELRAEHRKIPWRDIAGMRNKLIHEYFGVNLELVWRTIKQNLPELKKQLVEILKQTDERK